MWFFGKKKEEKKKEGKSKNLESQDTNRSTTRKYVRINRDIGIISPDLPGYKAVTRDISLGGAKIIISKPIKKGSIIKIGIEMETSNKPLELSAEVVWSNELEPNKKYEVGLKFIYNNPAQQQNIEKYILYILETQSNWYKTME
ncbi:MAG: PilZ domain-containing protein [Candidatus Calescibacterium sp.]|nr:PilZ domain-containing protein [Candidatus Calescibacterium sp.]MDW8133067.1 PilZ domain-containing protein [Candidatus Calescibacterium sp.]